jgi:hypothetical protein
MKYCKIIISVLLLAGCAEESNKSTNTTLQRESESVKGFKIIGEYHSKTSENELKNNNSIHLDFEEISRWFDVSGSFNDNKDIYELELMTPLESDDSRYDHASLALLKTVVKNYEKKYGKFEYSYRDYKSGISQVRCPSCSDDLKIDYGFYAESDFIKPFFGTLGVHSSREYVTLEDDSRVKGDVFSLPHKNCNYQTHKSINGQYHIHKQLKKTEEWVMLRANTVVKDIEFIVREHSYTKKTNEITYVFNAKQLLNIDPSKRLDSKKGIDDIILVWYEGANPAGLSSLGSFMLNNITSRYRFILHNVPEPKPYEEDDETKRINKMLKEREEERKAETYEAL